VSTPPASGPAAATAVGTASARPGAALLAALGTGGSGEVRLARAREYVRRRAVSGLAITPAEITAEVRGSRVEPYQVLIRVPAFDPGTWSTVLDVLADRAGFVAALVDGELPEDLVAAVSDRALVSLLPRSGEVGARCTCPDAPAVCKHVFAVALVVSLDLDRDPFVLLRLRGREREAVLAGWRGRLHGPAADVFGGTEPARSRPFADEEPATPGAPGPADPTTHSLPVLPPPPAAPGAPARITVAPPEGTVRVDELYLLAADAATRAWEVLTQGGDDGLSLTADQDLARRAAAVGPRGLEQLAKQTGTPVSLLARRAAAWRHGGAGALAALEEPWKPDYLELTPAIAVLGTSGHVSGNRVSDAADVRQLRLGRDGLWYPMVRVGGAWEVAGPPSPDPHDLL
jgi:hypothetical protein